MALGKRHELICVACRKAVHTLYSYPEDSCAAEGLADAEHVQCTKKPEHRDKHYDEFSKKYFEVQGRLKKGDTGQTARA